MSVGQSINEPASKTRPDIYATVSINEPPQLPEGADRTPTLSELEPAEATIGGADLTLQCIGTGFTPSSTITFNGGVEPTTFVSATEVTTIVKPSTATTPGEYPVTVVTPFGETEPALFEFLDGATRGTWGDPDELEDEIEQAEAEGEFKSLHGFSKTKGNKTVIVKKTKR